MDNDGTIKTNYGTREGDEIDVNDRFINIEIEKSEATRLGNNDLEIISNLLTGIQNDNKGNKEVYFDS